MSRIENNRLELFQRLPSDLRRYLGYTWMLKRDYGSVMTFIVKERLQWTDLTPRGDVPFSHSGLLNPEEYWH